MQQHRLLLHILLFTCLGCAAWAQTNGSSSSNFLWSRLWDFEDKSLGPIWVGIQYGTQCGLTCPTAVQGVKAEAGYRSNAGIRISINRTASEDAVQVAVPKFLLDTDRLASVCFMARHTNPKATLTIVALRWTTTAIDGIFSRKAQQFQAANAWQQFCLTEVEFLVKSVFSVIVNVGSVTGTIDIDNIELQVKSRDNATETEAWMNATDSRIESVRKGNLTLIFKDAATDKPLGNIGGGILMVLKQHDFPFGTAFTPENLRTAGSQDYSVSPTLQWYMDTTRNFPFNALVPENLFKWPVYEPTQGNYQPAVNELQEDYYKYANNYGISHIRGHAIEWYNSIYNNHWSRLHGCEKYLGYIKDRIQRDVVLAGNNFKSYDVINELLNEFIYYRQCNFNITVIADLFKQVAAVAPANTLLCINDYRIIEGDWWRDYKALIEQLLLAGAPLNCIGVQAHLTFGQVTTPMIKQRIDQLATLGLPIYITEVSLRTGYDDVLQMPINKLDDVNQARWLVELYRLWFSHPAIKGVWLWGWWDKLHWITNGGIYTVTGVPKVGATSLQTLFRVKWNTSAVHQGPLVLGSNGAVRIRAFYGTYKVKIIAGDGTPYVFNVNFPASKGPEQAAIIRLPSS